MNHGEAVAIQSWTENEKALRAALEKIARRYHFVRSAVLAADHRWWKFEKCPAEACSEARAALGMPPVMPVQSREPGEGG